MITIKIKDITSERQDIVSGLKKHSPEFSTVKVYACGPTRYIHSFNDNLQILSVSCFTGNVSEVDWVLGIQKIMKIKLVEALIKVRPSGVVFIRKKPKHLPRKAN